MKTLGTTNRWLARVVGLAVATGLTVLALSAWRVPAGRGELGADVLFASAPTGELAVDPAGPFLTAAGLTPGGEPGEGVVSVRNQTGLTLAVRVRVTASDTELADLLRTEVRAKGRIFRGSLADLDRDGAAPFELASGEERVLSVRVWLPAGAEGHEGRLAKVGVTLESTGAGG